MTQLKPVCVCAFVCACGLKNILPFPRINPMKIPCVFVHTCVYLCVAFSVSHAPLDWLPTNQCKQSGKTHRLCLQTPVPHGFSFFFCVCLGVCILKPVQYDLEFFSEACLLRTQRKKEITDVFNELVLEYWRWASQFWNEESREVSCLYHDCQLLFLLWGFRNWKLNTALGMCEDRGSRCFPIQSADKSWSCTQRVPDVPV